MDIYIYRHFTGLKLASDVALDDLSEHAGEAPSKRIFSIASRILKFDNEP